MFEVLHMTCYDSQVSANGRSTLDPKQEVTCQRKETKLSSPRTHWQKYTKDAEGQGEPQRQGRKACEHSKGIMFYKLCFWKDKKYSTIKMKGV